MSEKCWDTGCRRPATRGFDLRVDGGPVSEVFACTRHFNGLIVSTKPHPDGSIKRVRSAVYSDGIRQTIEVGATWFLSG